MNRWTEEEAESIYNQVKGLWTEPNKEVWNLMRKRLSRFYARTIRYVLEDLKEHPPLGVKGEPQSSRFLPEIGQILDRVDAYIERRRRSDDERPETEDCEHCKGVGVVWATAYVADPPFSVRFGEGFFSRDHLRGNRHDPRLALHQEEQ